MIIRKYTEKDISEMVHIWNEVVEDGEAFPQEEFLDDKTGAEFFASQTYCGVADKDGQIVGLYILQSRKNKSKKQSSEPDAFFSDSKKACGCVK